MKRRQPATHLFLRRPPAETVPGHNVVEIGHSQPRWAAVEVGSGAGAVLAARLP
jgi:hypothetical protein